MKIFKTYDPSSTHTDNFSSVSHNKIMIFFSSLRERGAVGPAIFLEIPRELRTRNDTTRNLSFSESEYYKTERKIRRCVVSELLRVVYIKFIYI